MELIIKQAQREAYKEAIDEILKETAELNIPIEQVMQQIESDEFRQILSEVIQETQDQVI